MADSCFCPKACESICQLILPLQYIWRHPARIFHFLDHMRDALDKEHQTHIEKKYLPYSQLKQVPYDRGKKSNSTIKPLLPCRNCGIHGGNRHLSSPEPAFLLVSTKNIGRYFIYGNYYIWSTYRNTCTCCWPKEKWALEYSFREKCTPEN